MKKELLFLAISLCASLTLNAQTISPTVPASVEVGTNLTVSGTYTISDNGIIQVSMSIYNGNVWDSDISSVSQTLNPAVSGTDVTLNIVVAIPDDITPSASLTGTGTQNYKVIVKLYDSEWGENRDPAWTALAGEIIDIELIAATAGIEDINADGLVMYPNPVSDILRIKNVDVSEIKSFQIVDILGQVVIKQNNDKKVNSIDVSELSKGLYFLISNNNRQFKFIKE